MISVIVPVYNVEPYLRKCLDSILAQTYQDLEILVIDDGSTDGSGKICDEYAEKERWIRVFHTENNGLSCARNLGLDNANGDWIGFVDSDDWIEPDMFEVLLRRAQETGADVVDCGWYWEYPDRIEEHKGKEQILSSMEAIHMLVKQEIFNGVWNRLWKRRCFEGIRFPEGRIHEDVATTYRVFLDENCVCVIPDIKYHYRQRKDSLSNILDMNYLAGFWRSHKERYDALNSKLNEADVRELLKYCGVAVARTWAHYYDCAAEERAVFCQDIMDMYSFTKRHYPMFGFSGWEIKLRVGVFFSHFKNCLSFRAAWAINKLR